MIYCNLKRELLYLSHFLLLINVRTLQYLAFPAIGTCAGPNFLGLELLLPLKETLSPTFKKLQVQAQKNQIFYMLTCNNFFSLSVNDFVFIVPLNLLQNLTALKESVP